MKNEGRLCIAPWVHFIYDYGKKILPCCASYSHTEGQILNEDWQENLNGGYFQNIRKQMLDGHTLAMCKECDEKEEHGLSSDRKRYNKIYSEELAQVRENRNLKIDFENIKSVDLRFSNFCNMSCRTCNPHASSAWNQDSMALGDIKEPIHRKVENPGLPELPSCKIYYFIGGEVFLDADHENFLESLSKKPNSGEITIDYNSNLSFSENVIDRLVPIWKKFKKIKIAASLDHYQKEAFEYIRHQGNYNLIEKNFKKLQTLPFVELEIQLTLSLLNIYELPEIISHFDKTLNLPLEKVDIIPLYDPPYYSITALPEKAKKEIERKLLSSFKIRVMENDLSPTSILLHSYMKKMVDYMNSRDDSPSYPLFFERMKKLDQLRSQNFEDSLKKTAQFLKNYI